MNSKVEAGIAAWLAAALPNETVRPGVENADLGDQASAKYVVVILGENEHVVGEYFRAEVQFLLRTPIVQGDKSAHKALESAVYGALQAASISTISGYVETATSDEFSVNGKFVRSWERTSDAKWWESYLNVVFGVGPAES